MRPYQTSDPKHNSKSRLPEERAMKRWMIIICVAVLAALAAACQRDLSSKNGEGGGGEGDPNIANLSHAIEQLSVWQVGEQQAEEIVTYESDSLGAGLPDQPTTIAIHESEAVIKMRLRPDANYTPDQIERLIRVTGAEHRIESLIDVHGYEIVLLGMTGDVELQLGDLQKIRLRKADRHLTYMLNQSSLKNPYSLLIHSEEEGSSHVFIRDEEEYIVLRFSEPMIRIERPGTEWLSDTQLMIRLDEAGHEFDLSEYYSTEGNFLANKHRTLKIHPTNSRSWFDAASGGLVGWSDRDAYYDALVFSPDGSRYAGLVQLSKDEDGGWAYYGVVIEQAGKAPIVLDLTIHAPVSDFIRVEWRDNGTLLVLSAFELWAYVIETGTSHLVTGGDGEAQAVAFQFDRRNGMIFVLQQTVETVNGREYLQGSMHIYDAQLKLSERVNTISDPWPSSENATMPLDISVRTNGYYLTTYRDGKIVTYYRSNGQEVYAPGRLIGATDAGAYLIDSSGGGIRLYWWPSGGSAQPVTPLADADYLMFGGDLFARLAGNTNTFYGYNRARDEWIEWSPNDDGRDSWIPNQRTAFYRVTD